MIGLLLAHNQEAIENRLKQNNRYAAFIKKDKELKALEEKARLKREADQLAMRLKNASILPKENLSTEDSDELPALVSENFKKEYSEPSKGKEKTRGIADPDRAVEEVVPIALANKPLVRIESLISGVPLKIFRDLFGPYEKCPVMDDKQKIHPDQIKTLMKALDFPYSFSGGKGDHTKGILLSEDDDGNLQEYMIIIPYRVPGIDPHYIKSLRENFISMGLYPQELEDNLIKAGLLK